jgi:hypothetical protein
MHPYSSRAFQWDPEGGKTHCGLGLTNESNEWMRLTTEWTMKWMNEKLNGEVNERVKESMNDGWS